MNKGLLNLKPTRYLCPYCGKWHKWKSDWWPYLTPTDREKKKKADDHNLGYYNSSFNSAYFKCWDEKICGDMVDHRIYFNADYCYCYFSLSCDMEEEIEEKEIDLKIPISSIIESKDKPIVTFEISPFTERLDIDIHKCSDCMFEQDCIILDIARGNGNKPVTLGFEFEESDYKKYADVKNSDLSCEEKRLQEQKQSVNGVNVKKRDVKKAREDAEVNKEQVSQQPQVKENKEETTMANNTFNMNMEFGPNKDENIASTLMGVAVRNGDSWRIYDKKKKEITDVGDMQLGNLPIFILPTTKLTEGDLIKDSGEYYFVTKVATVKTPTQTLSARTGELKNIVPIKNILGFSCYSKVIAFSDSLDTGKDFDVEKLAIMSAMCDQTSETNGQMNQFLPLMLFKDKLGGDDNMMNMLLMSSMMPPGNDGNQMNQMLPLMLFKDKLGGDDNMMNMLLMSSMMTPGNDGNQMNQMLPLMLFKDKLGGDDDMMNMLLMSSMMGGDMAGSNNPMMNYLMLDSFIGKKDSKVPQSDDGTAK